MPLNILQGAGQPPHPAIIILPQMVSGARRTDPWVRPPDGVLWGASALEAAPAAGEGVWSRLPT